MIEIENKHCTDCDVLTEALRDLEQQCREAEDQRSRDAALTLRTEYYQMLLQERRYLAKIRKLERRRDCAFQLLLKHQQLEHS